jgi:aminocarboxymuconate-semialdehyde decarboxylase
MRRDGDGYLFELGPDSFVPFSGAMVDLDALLELMEGNGIDVLVSSSEPLSVTGWQIDEAAEAARVLNEEKARAQERHPDRYVGLATLPLQDPERALEELEHAVVKRGLGGVCFPSNVQGSPITSPELMPLYERIEELGVPLFLHPTASIARERLRDYGLDYVIGYMLDTSVAALNLVFSGTTRRCPGLKIVHPHLGAVLPYLAGGSTSSTRLRGPATRSCRRRRASTCARSGRTPSRRRPDRCAWRSTSMATTASCSGPTSRGGSRSGRSSS